MSGTGLNVADLTATVRLVDELTPMMSAMQATAAGAARDAGNAVSSGLGGGFIAAAQAAEVSSANSVRSIGLVSAQLAIAQADVRGLKQEFANSAGTGSGMTDQIVSELDAAITRVDALKAELSDLQNPPPPPGGGGGGGGGGWDDYFGNFAADVAAYATGMIAFTAVLGTVKDAEAAVVDEVSTATTAFAEQQSVTMRLVAALTAQGTAAPTVIQAEKDIATALQDHSTFSDKAVQSTEALLVQVGGIMPSQMQAATQATLDLAAGLGVDLDTAARMVSKSAEGSYQSLQRYCIVVDQSRITTEGFSAVLDTIEQKFGGQAQAQVGTYAGQVAQLQNNIENLQEAVGGAIVQNPLFVEGMQALESAVKDASGATIDSTHSFSSLIDVLPGFGPLAAGMVAGLEDLASETVQWDKTLASLQKTVNAMPGSVNQLSAAFKAENQLQPWQSVMTDADKAQQTIHDISQATDQLTAAQKQAATAAFQHGLSISQAEQAMRAYWPNIDQSAISLDTLKKSVDAANQSTKQQNQAWADYNALAPAAGNSQKLLNELYDQYGATVVEAIKYDLTRTSDLKMLATVYGVNIDAVKQIQAETKLETAEYKNQAAQLTATITAIQQYETVGVKAADAVAKGMNDGQNVLQALAVQMQDMPVIAQPFVASTLVAADGFGKMQTQIQGVIGLMPDLSSDAQLHMAEMMDSVMTLGKAFDDTFSSMPTIVERAMTGGGGLSGALQGIGSTFGTDIGKEIQTNLTRELTDNGQTVLGPFAQSFLKAIPGLTSLLGPALSGIANLIKGLFGPSPEELAARQAAQQVVSGINAISTATEQAEAKAVSLSGAWQGNEAGAQALITVRDAYINLGSSVDDAIAKSNALMAVLNNATHESPAAVAAANTQIQQLLQESQQHTTDVSNAVTALTTDAKNLGTAFPAALAPVIQQLSSMPGLTSAESTALNGLLTSSQPTFADLQKTAANYGLTLQDLGPKFQQAGLNTTADQIITDFQNLTQAGGNAGAIIQHMGGQVGDMVQQALQYGLTLPTALQPIIDNLEQTGQLATSTGTKIGDISQLKFDDSSDPLSKSIDTLTQALNNLSDLLKNQLPAAASSGVGAINRALGTITAPTIQIHATVDDGTASTSVFHAGGFVNSFHAGTPIVVAHSGLMPDEQPAILQTGEAVLNRRATASIGTQAISAWNAGVEAPGGVDMSKVESHLARMNDSIDALRSDMATRIPMMTAIAMKNAVSAVRPRR